MLVAVRNRYPLESVVAHRRHQVDERARDLADRTQQAAAASLRRVDATQQLAEHQSQVRETTDAERDRVMNQQACVDDLLRLQAWQLAQQQRATVLQNKLDETRRGEQDALEHRADATRSLSSAHVQTRMIEQHRDAHLARQRALHQLMIEEEGADIANFRYGRRKA